MALTTEQQADLDNLRAAYRKLIRGEAVAEASAFGRTVKYAQGDVIRLKAEIDSLEAQASESGNRRGALRFRVR